MTDHYLVHGTNRDMDNHNHLIHKCHNIEKSYLVYKDIILPTKIATMVRTTLITAVVFLTIAFPKIK